LNFIAEEDRLAKLSLLKISALENGEAKKLDLWLQGCKSFNDFEEFYIMRDKNTLNDKFYLDWFKSCSYYKERREVYQLAENEDLQKNLTTIWVKEEKTLEGLREAITHTEKDDDNYRLGIQKIFQIYKT
jgi:hypothetical protein